MEINNENNAIKFELAYNGKTDLTKVVEDAYNDGAKVLVKELGRTGATVLGFINNTLGAPIQIYNAWAKQKIEQVKNHIENSMKDIPPENLTAPSMNVLLPAIDGLKYNLDEDILKERFEKLIVNSCNSDYSNIIHPRFAEIIKQLSHNDALFIKELSANPLNGFPIANIITNNLETPHQLLFPNCFYSDKLDCETISASVDNLTALGLVKIDYSNSISDEKSYDTIKSTKIYRILALQQHNNISLHEGILQITILGRNFIKVCI